MLTRSAGNKGIAYLLVLIVIVITALFVISSCFNHKSKYITCRYNGNLLFDNQIDLDYDRLPNEAIVVIDTQPDQIDNDYSRIMPRSGEEPIFPKYVMKIGPGSGQASIRAGSIFQTFSLTGKKIRLVSEFEFISPSGDEVLFGPKDIPNKQTCFVHSVDIDHPPMLETRKSLEKRIKEGIVVPHYSAGGFYFCKQSRELDQITLNIGY
ncbi:MAG: hypothetical protein ACM3UZ_07855 [Acidobacteriota bacterium]